MSQPSIFFRLPLPTTTLHARVLESLVEAIRKDDRKALNLLQETFQSLDEEAAQLVSKYLPLASWAGLRAVSGSESIESVEMSAHPKLRQMLETLLVPIRFPGLTELRLRHCTLDDRSLGLLLGSKSLSHLVTLDLSYSSIPQEGEWANLEKCTRLERLNLGWTNLRISSEAVDVKALRRLTSGGGDGAGGGGGSESRRGAKDASSWRDTPTKRRRKKVIDSESGMVTSPAFAEAIAPSSSSSDDALLRYPLAVSHFPAGNLVELNVGHCHVESEVLLRHCRRLERVVLDHVTPPVNDQSAAVLGLLGAGGGGGQLKSVSIRGHCCSLAGIGVMLGGGLQGLCLGDVFDVEQVSIAARETSLPTPFPHPHPSKLPYKLLHALTTTLSLTTLHLPQLPTLLSSLGDALRILGALPNLSTLTLTTASSHVSPSAIRTPPPLTTLTLTLTSTSNALDLPPILTSLPTLESLSLHPATAGISLTLESSPATIPPFLRSSSSPKHHPLQHFLVEGCKLLTPRAILFLGSLLSLQTLSLRGTDTSIPPTALLSHQILTYLSSDPTNPTTYIPPSTPPSEKGDEELSKTATSRRRGRWDWGEEEEEEEEEEGGGEGERGEGGGGGIEVEWGRILKGESEEERNRLTWNIALAMTSSFATLSHDIVSTMCQSSWCTAVEKEEMRAKSDSHALHEALVASSSDGGIESAMGEGPEEDDGEDEEDGGMGVDGIGGGGSIGWRGGGGGGEDEDDEVDVEAVAEFFQKPRFPSLQQLVLRHIPIEGESGAEALASFLRLMPSLRFLDLRASTIPVKHLRDVIVAAGENALPNELEDHGAPLYVLAGQDTFFVTPHGPLGPVTPPTLLPPIKTPVFKSDSVIA